ncbi:MAG: CmcI family methyltransferase [Vicinamibacteria bacterium]
MEDCLDMSLRELLPHMQKRIVEGTTYFGVRALKNPLDFWIYQEILFEARPDAIVEIGTRFGGSALALAHLCAGLGKGRVISIDLSHEDVAPAVREHPRITLIEGDACASFSRVSGMCRAEERVLVIEDSSHTYENTLGVLRRYSSLVKPGGYFIVEDGICRHGLEVGPSPGPYEAVATFTRENGDFEIDRKREGFLITWNPKGFLQRVK